MPQVSLNSKEVAKNFLLWQINDTGVNWTWWLIFSWVVGSYLWFFVPKVILSFLLCLSLFILIGCICFSVFLLSDYWWVVFSALNFQYWLVCLSKTRKRLVILSSSSLVHYSRFTFCLLYNLSKIQPSLKALSTQKKWPRIFYFHWLTARKMLRL